MNPQSQAFIPKQNQTTQPPFSLLNPPPGFPKSYLIPIQASPSSTSEANQTPIELLCAIFPNIEPSTLQQTLTNNGNDISKAVLTLSQTSDAASEFILEEIYNDQLNEDELDEGEYEDEGEDDLEEENEEPPPSTTKGTLQITSTPFVPVFMHPQFTPSTSNPTPITQPSPPPSSSSLALTTKPPPPKPVPNHQAVNPTKPKPAPPTTAKASSQKIPPKSSKEEQQVCKYFLLGTCYRKDCFYVHSNAVVCKYWKLGSCSRGDSCIYLHSEPEAEEPRKLQKAPSKPTPLPQAIQQPIPPVQTPKPDIVPPLRNPPGFRKVDMAAKLRLTQLQKLFHHVGENTVRDIFYSCNFNTEEATDKLTRIHGKPRKIESEVAATTEPIFKPAARKPKQWVATGDSVANLYSEYRNEAIEHATIRNTCFHYATTAYLSGDGLAAKEWSKRGRHHDEMMKKLHREACMKILETRNKDLSSQMIMDLHGLHKREAIEVLSQKIEFFKQKNANMHGGEKRVHAFYIIVGTGHHANVGKNQSLIGKAVQGYLDDMRIKYADCSDDHRGGMLTVYIE